MVDIVREYYLPQLYQSKTNIQYSNNNIQTGGQIKEYLIKELNGLNGILDIYNEEDVEQTGGFIKQSTPINCGNDNIISTTPSTIEPTQTGGHICPTPCNCEEDLLDKYFI